MSTRPRRSTATPANVSASSFIVEGLEARVLLSATPLPDSQAKPAAATEPTTVVQPATTPAAPAIPVPVAQLSPGLHMFNQEENAGGVIWVLTQAEINELSAGKSIVYFGDAALSMHIVVGDGTSTPVVFSAPTTVLRGDTIRFSSPVIANQLIIEGDGTTTLFDSDATALSGNLTLTDSLLISGDRKMTANAGDIRITGGSVVNGAAGGADDNLTLNASGKVTFTGDVGNISDGTLGNGPLKDFTIENATDISFQAFHITGNLLIKKGTSVTFAGAVDIGGNLTIEDGGSISFGSTVTVGGNLTILKATGNVTFGGAATVAGDLAIGSHATYTNIGAVTFSNLLDFGGAGSVYTAGTITFSNIVGGSSTYRPDALTLGATGAVTFTNALKLDSTVPFIVENATSVTFNNDVTSGNATIGAGAGGQVSGNVLFQGTTKVESLDVVTTGSSALVSFLVLQVGAGGASVTANNIDFASGGQVNATSTAATLTLKPYDTTRAIGVGTLYVTSGETVLDLNATDLKAIKTGFAAVNIGDAQAGTGAVYLGYIGDTQGSANGASLVNPMHFYGGSVSITRDLDVATLAGQLQLVARTGNITVNGSVNAFDPTNVVSATRNAWLLFQAAGNILINRAVYAADRISLVAGTTGTGSITVDNSGSNSGLLRTVATAGVATYSRRIELVAGETSGNIVLTSANLTANAVTGFLSNLVLRANGGAITQTGAGLLTGSNLAFWASGNVVINTAVDTIASATLEGAILPGGSGALATATINAGGALTALNVTGAGSGYTVAPTVTVLGDGRVVGTGTATIKGPVASLFVTSGGSGYTSAPTVTLTGGGGTGATAGTVTLINGVITAIAVSAGGTDYQTAPTVTITGGGGTGAAARAVINGIVTAISVDVAGTGYTFAPVVVLTGGRSAVVGNGGQMVGNGDVTITEANAITVANFTTAGSVTTPGAFTLTTAASDIKVGYINTFSGAINLNAAGAILDLTPSTDASEAPNLATSGRATLTAFTGIGATGAADLDVALGQLAATNHTSGDIVINQLGITGRTLTVAGAGIVNESAAGGVSLYAESQSGQTDGASIAVSAVITAAGSGNVLVQAVGITSSITLDAVVSSLTGSLSVLANFNVLQNAGGTLSSVGTGSTGTIDVEATLGSITMAATATAKTLGKNIRYKAADTVTVGVLDTRTAADRTGGTTASQLTWGDISILAGIGAIADAKLSAATAVNLYGRKLRLQAATGIGTLANSLETEGDTASALAAAGPISLVESTGLTIDDVSVTVNRVAAALTTGTQTDAIQSDLVTSANNGAISVKTLAGGLVLNAGTDGGNAITAHGSGAITLDVDGGALTVNARVSTTTGVIAFTADTIAQKANVETTTGTVTYVTDVDDIVMNDGFKTLTTTGNIAFTAKRDLKLSVVQSTSGTLQLTAQTGAITDNTVAETANLVSTGQATLSAATGIGTSATGGDINTTLDTLEATNATSGGIYIRESDTLVVNGTGVRTTGGNGPVAIDVVNGPLTLSSVVTAHGSGTVHLAAIAGLLTTNAAVGSATGAIDASGTGVAQNAAIATGGAGTVSVIATSASITMADLTTTTTATGAINYTAAINVLLSLLTSTSGALNVTATAGAISDHTALEAANLVTTGLATLTAALGIGATGASDIDTDVGTLVAHNTGATGQIVVEALHALTVGSAGVVNDAADQPIVITTLDGGLTVNGQVKAAGLGRILLGTARTVAPTADLTIAAAVSSSGGHLSLLAADSLALATGASVATTLTGTLDLEATLGSLTIADAVTVTTASGNIRLYGQVNVAVTGVATTAGSVTVTAATGSITDSGDTLTDIAAVGLRLNAAGGIGGNGTTFNALEIAVGTLAAAATTGGIRLVEADDVTVGTVAALTVNRVSAAAAISDLADAADTSDLATTTGDIQLRSLAGSIVLNDGVLANGKAVVSTSGSVTLRAAVDVTQNSGIATGSAGTVSVTADTGSITMADLTATTTATGAINYTAAVNVLLSLLTSTSGALNVTATAGAISDHTALEAANLVTTARATLVAATGIGAADTANINTTIGELAATNTLSGGVFVLETAGLVIAGAGVQTQAGNGPVSVVVTTGDLTVNSAVSAHGSGNVLLNALGTGANLLVNSAVSSGSGNLSLRAHTGVTFDGTADLAVALAPGTIEVEAANGSILTNVATLVARTNGTNIRFTAAQSVTLGVLDARTSANRTDGLLTGQAALWGNIAVTATGGSIHDAKSAAGTAVNLYARSSRLVSSTGIGQTGASVNALETELATIAAVSANGSINLVDSSALVVGVVSGFVVQHVAADATSADATVLADIEDVRTTTSGAIVVRTLSGNLTLNGGTATSTAAVVAAGADNILLSAAAALVVNANVTSGGGALTLQSLGGDITFATDADALTTGSGTVDLVSSADITLSTTSDVKSGSGNIRLLATNNILLGGIVQTTTNVSLIATNGWIHDRDTDNSVDIDAAGLRLVASTGIGQSTNHLETTVATLSARAGLDGIFIKETNALTIDDVTVTVARVGTDALTANVVDAIQSDVITTADGAVVIIAGGALTLNDGTAAVDHTAVNASGVLRLEATAITANADIVSDGDAITLLSTTGAITAAGNADILTTGSGTVDLKAATDITLSTGSDVKSTNGNIRLEAANNITLGGVVQTTTNVSLIATSGWIHDGDSDGSVDVIAAGLRLVASTGIGQSTNHLETTVTTLSARAGLDGVFIKETDALIVDDVTVTVSRVAQDATSADVVDAIQSDIVTTADGAVVIIAGGALTLNDGTTTDHTAVNASGVLRLEATAITANADIVSDGDAITLLSTTGAITAAGNADILTTGSGTVDLKAATDITLSTGSDVKSTNGNIRLEAANNITLGGVVQTTTNVSLIATSGWIHDGDSDGSVDVIAAGLRLVASTGIGQSTNHLETTVATLSARAGLDGVFIKETDALTIGDVAVTVSRIGQNAVAADVVDATQSDIVTTADGAVVIIAGGALTLNDGTAAADHTAVNASGVLRLEATAITANADILSDGDAITLVSTTGAITAAGNADILTTGNGTVDLKAATDITLSTGSDVKSTNGNIRLEAANNITLGGVVQTTTNVSLIATSGWIHDGDSDGSVDVIASGLRLVAATGIGQSTNHLETTVATLSARAGLDGIFIKETDALTVDDVTVTVSRVAQDAGIADVIDAIQSDIVTTADGAVVIIAGGALTLNDGTAAADHTAVNASGVLRLEATTITANADILSDGDAITLVSTTGAITVTTNADILTTGSGTVDLKAATDITLSTGSDVKSTNGNIRLEAANNITLGGVVQTTTNVSLIATSGWIHDGDSDGSVDVIASGLRLVASTGIGQSTNPIETTVATLSARAGLDGVFIKETDALTIGDVAVTVSRIGQNAVAADVVDATQSDIVTTADGAVVIIAGGALTLNDGTAATDHTAVNASGVLRLEATAITANADVLSDGDAITLVSTTGAITVTTNADILTTGSGTVDLKAATDITLSTGSDVKSTNGNIRLEAANNITLGGVVQTTTNVSLIATSGWIHDGDTDNSVDVIAAGLRLVASTGIGQSTNHLETTVATLSARAGLDGVFIKETDALTIGDVAVTVSRIGQNAVAADVVDATQSDIVTTADGAVVIIAGGALTLNDGTAAADHTAVNASGVLRLEATTITANADIVSDGDAITLVSTTGAITVTTNADILTTGSGTVDLKAATDITLSTGSDVKSTNGNIRLEAANNITLGGVVQTTTNVSLIATSGWIHDGDTDNSVDVIAAGLRLVASTGIGQSTNHLETTVATLSARAGLDGVFIKETDALTIGDVAVTVSRIGQNAVAADVVDATQSDVITTADGAVVIIAGGALTLNDGTAAADHTAVNASGVLHLEATTITANADIVSDGDAITLVSTTGAITAAGNADILTTGSGTVDLKAATDITLSTGSDVKSTNGNIRLEAANNITLGGIVQTTTNVSLIATSGWIHDGDTDNSVDVIAAGLRLVASTGIGQSTNHLETTVATLSARAGLDGIFIKETDALTIDNVAVTVSRIGTDATTSAITDASQSDVASTGDLVIAAAGNLVLNVGTGTVDEAGLAVRATGNIRLTSGGAFTANAAAAIQSAGSHVTLVAANDLEFKATANVATTGTGTVILQSTAGSIIQADNSRVASDTGDILVDAQNSITVGGFTTGGNVALTARTGAILDAGDLAGGEDIVASGLRLVAHTGIGTGAAHLETSVATLAVSTGTAGVYLTETNALTIDDVSIAVSRVLADATTAVDGAVALSDIVSTGNVVLQTLGGDLTLNDGTAGTAGLAVSAAGNILLAVTGSLVANSDVTGTANGAITVLATAAITFNSGADVTAGAASIDLEAGTAIHFDATSRITNTAGNIRLLATTGDITVSGIDAGAGAVSLEATAGSILDGGDINRDVTASALRLVAGTAAGTAANALDVTIGTLAGIAGSGGVNLSETNALAIDTVTVGVDIVGLTGVATAGTAETSSDVVTTAGGNIVLTTLAGSLTLNDGTDADGLALDAAGSGTITLTIQGVNADLVANADLRSGTGEIKVTADGAITLNTAADIRTGGSVNAKALAGDITMTSGTVIAAGGGADLNASANLLVSQIDTGTAEITLTAGGTITDNLAAETPNLTGAKATLRAVNSIGTLADDLNTQLGHLDAIVSGTGDLVINDVDGLIADNAATTDGDIQLTAGGDLTLTTVVAGGTGDITLTTTAGDLVLGAVTAEGNTITATAAARIEQVNAAGTTANLTADTLDLNAGTGIGTQATVLVAATTLSADATTGDIHLRNLLATATTVTSIVAHDGAIDLSQAGGTLTIQGGSATGDIDVAMDTGNLNASNLTADGDVSFTITGSGKVTFDHVSADGGAGNIGVTTLDKVVLDTDVITNGENLTFTGDVTLGANATIDTGGGNLHFTQGLDGGHILTVNAGTGDVTFDTPIGATTALTGLVITTEGNVSLSAVHVNGDTTINSETLVLTGGANSVHGTGTFTAAPFDNVATIGLGGGLSGTFGYSLSQATLAALAPGYSQIAIGRADSAALVTLGNATYQSPTLIQSPAAGGQIVVEQTVTTTSNLTLQAYDRVTVASTGHITAGSGTVTLIADQLALGGAANSISGTGTLNLQPTQIGTVITVGSGSNGGGLDLSIAELATIKTGFAHVVIGRADGANAVTITQVNLANPTEFLSPLGTITIVGAVTSTNAGANLAVNGGTVTIGSGTLGELIAKNGSVTITVNGGHLVIGNDYTQIKAAGNLQITGTAGAIIDLRGQITVVGTMTVQTAGDITTQSLRLTAIGTVRLEATGTIDLRGGLLTSQNASLILAADSDQDGVGDLFLGSVTNAAISGHTSVTISGNAITIGTVSTFVILYSGGDLSVLANLDGDAIGNVTVRNSSTVFRAAGALRIGQNALTAGTPYQLDLGGARFTAGGQLTLASLADLTLAGIALSAQNQLALLTRSNLTISNGSVISSGQGIAFYADVTHTTISTDSRLSPAPSLYPAPL